MCTEGERFTDMPLVETTDLKKTYQAGEVRVEALRGVRLAIEPSSFVSVIGPSGSGKTTLLNLIGCLDVPTAGRVRVLDIDVTSLDRHERTAFRGKHIGFVFQDFNLVPVLSAYENAEYPLLMTHSGPSAERRKRVQDLFEAVGIPELANKRPDQLSGGQKQRVAIARALVTRPRLVLADEPTANLDHDTAAVIIALMKKMRDESGTTFIFSTHDPYIVSEAETVFTLEDGRLVNGSKEGGDHA